MQNNIIVMKFGGTSVATAKTRLSVLERIRAELALGSQVVVVVSAMGRKGDAYATDTLLSLVGEGAASAHETDVLMSAGETISAVVLSTELKNAGIDALALTAADAGIICNAVDGLASITHIDVAAIKAVLDSGQIAVVTGFQAVDAGGHLHTLGRGGSDTSACAIAVALGAKRVDIYSDVDGVFTADPHELDEAHVLQSITADELFQMAKHGSQIVHAPAAELALQSGVNMRVRNSFSAAAGTEVISMERFKSNKVATAVTTTDGIVRVRVSLPDAKMEPEHHMRIQTKIFRLLADNAISIDMFTPMNDRLVFAVKAADAELAEQLLKAKRFSVACRRELGKVSLVGSGMHGVPGVMAKVAECLLADGIDILQVADSHATISLLVDATQLTLAAKALHRAFEL